MGQRRAIVWCPVFAFVERAEPAEAAPSKMRECSTRWIPCNQAVAMNGDTSCADYACNLYRDRGGFCTVCIRSDRHNGNNI